MTINEERCVEFGLDVKKVTLLARRISKAIVEANKMGLILFGGAGSADLRKSGGSSGIVADLDGRVDGGDGGDDW